MKNRSNSHTVIPREGDERSLRVPTLVGRILSSVSLGAILQDYEYCLTQFVLALVRRASSNARLARALIVHDRRDRAAGCGARPQSPAPQAPRLSAYLRFLSHRRCRAFFRQRTSPASARIFHPVLLVWHTPARKSALLPARSCFRIVAQSEALRNVSSTGAELVA